MTVQPDISIDLIRSKMYGPRFVKISLRRRGGTLSGREDVEQILVKMKERFKTLEEGRRKG